MRQLSLQGHYGKFLVLPILIILILRSIFVLNINDSARKSRKHPSQEMRVLVVGVGQVRGSIYAWNSLVSNLLYPFKADLALLVTKQAEHSFLHDIAKYVWTEEEYDDWGVVLSAEAKACGSNPEDWKMLCEVPDQWTGGIHACNQPGSAGILLAFRLMLHRKISELRLLEKYDMFIWTRLDELYICRHADFTKFQAAKNVVYLPKGEHWGGWSDRHLVAAGPAFMKAIGIANELVCSPRKWLSFLRSNNASYPINLEKLQALMWKNLDLTVEEFHRSMFTVKTPEDPTRWAVGSAHKILCKFNLLVKYPTELQNAEEDCKSSLDSFAKDFPHTHMLNNSCAGQ